MSKMLVLTLVLSVFAVSSSAANEQNALCWEKICAGMTLDEAKKRLKTQGYEYHSNWFANFKERIVSKIIPIGGFSEFEQYRERVSANSGMVTVEIDVFRFPSGRRRIVSLYATEKIDGHSAVQLAEAISEVERKWGPPDDVSWDEVYPRYKTVIWNGTWYDDLGGSRNWRRASYVSDLLNGSYPTKEEDQQSALSGKVTLIEHKFNSMDVAFAVETALAGESAGWILDKRKNCRVWNNYPRDDEHVTWDGQCSEGKAEGYGRLSWFSRGVEYETVEGNFHDGRINGEAFVKVDDGHFFEGEFKDNRPNGFGTFTQGDKTYSGIWRDGCLMQNWRRLTFYAHIDMCD